MAFSPQDTRRKYLLNGASMFGVSWVAPKAVRSEGLDPIEVGECEATFNILFTLGFVNYGQISGVQMVAIR